MDMVSAPIKQNLFDDTNEVALNIALPINTLGVKSSFSSFVPGTSQFDLRMHRVVIAYVRQQQARFLALQSLSDDAKRKLQPFVRRYSKQLGTLQAWQQNFLFWLMMLLILPSGLIATHYLDRFLKLDSVSAMSPGWGVEVAYYGLYIAGVVGWVFAFFWPLLLPKKMQLVLPTLVLYVWPIILLCFYASCFYYVSTHYRATPALVPYLLVALLKSAKFAFYSLILFVLILFLIVAPVKYLFERRGRRYCPEATIFISLLSALSLLERQRHQWQVPANKRTLVLKLETAASCLERELVRSLRAGDVVSDVLVANTLSERAAAMRELKQWVLTPKPDTYSILRQRIADDFVNVTAGHWDTLTAAKPQKLSLAEGVSTGITQVVRGLMSAAVPIITLLIIRYLKLPFEGPVARYATVGVVLWAALTLIRVLDPQFKATLEAFQMIINIIRGK